MLTLAVGDDVSVQYVATEARHRRQGLASRLLVAVLAAERARGMRSATLQASPDGLPVYERLGFRRVALLKAFLRP
jgi:ribosomal protein S18 acetylase RimI-like enzyme